MSKKVIGFIIAIFFCTSCGESFSENNGGDEPKVEQNTVSEFQINLVEKESFKYEVQISLPNVTEYGLLRTDEIIGEEVVISDSAINAFTDTVVKAGHVYKYRIIDLESDQEVFKKTISIPLEIVSSREEYFPQSYLSIASPLEDFELFEVNNLVLVENSIIFTQGRNLHLRVKNIISTGGIIKAFKSETVASKGQKGRSGGKLVVEVENIEGHVVFHLNGEKGGQGIKPPQLGIAGKGTTGSKGSNGYEVTVCNDDPGGQCSTECLSEPGDGGTGGPGKKGSDGNIGLQGGDTGRVFIQSKSIDINQITIIKEPGKGGHGSLGGKGGPGGDGGARGDIEGTTKYGQAQDRDDYCDTASSGPTGAEGPRGNPGTNGPEGLINTSCYREQTNDLWICTL